MMSKREYYQAIIKRYHRSSRAEKGRILDEFCENCGYNRSYAIRLLNQGHKRLGKKPGRRSKYDNQEFIRALRNIWKGADYKCGKRLKKAIPSFLPYYEKHHGNLAPEIELMLLKISPATIDRVLRKTKALYYGKGKSLTKPGSLLRSQIPISTECWDVALPGYVEADTVAHCGISSQGPFALTLTLTDINTTWTENRAVWTKKAENVVEQIKDIEASLPFHLLGFDCDNGSEFLNDHLVRYFQKKRIPLTRSRPYRKNDNAHVEQKNWTHARQLFGYMRIENPDCIPLMNDLYANEWCWYQNFFSPSFKMKEKRQVKSKYKRIYDEPQTPYERVLQSPFVDEEKKQKLKILFESLDPFELKKKIDAKARNVAKLANITFEQWKLIDQTKSL
ncbi:MAG: transposase family protein [Bdellovibrionales bacterium]|nr:transposase family protein [Bdellovibrionales bacterium]